MIDLEIISAGVYRMRQRRTQYTDCFSVGLHISGLLHHRLYYPDGELLESFSSDPGPNLFWRAPGMRIDFDYGSKRENRVIMLKSSCLHYDKKTKTLYTNFLKNNIPIPFRLQVSPEQVSVLRKKFEEITLLWQEALPASQLSACLKIGELFASVHKLKETVNSKQSPASRLKQLIDNDTGFAHNLEELCQEFAHSKDHLRLCFQKEYHLLPSTYRENLRMRKIMELITESDLTAKEIACAVGLKHASHLNLLLRSAYNRTPSELIRMYRFRSLG